VVVKRVKELTDEDAKKDGFRNINELIDALKRIYGGIKGEDLVTIIHFEIPEKSSPSSFCQSE